MTVLEFPRSWKVGAKTPADPNWIFNNLRFRTKKDAENYARDLMRRWTLVTDIHIEPSEDEPNQP
jgi:hypothetical protein